MGRGIELRNTAGEKAVTKHQFPLEPAGAGDTAAGPVLSDGPVPAAVQFYLPFPPSLNNMFINVRKGRIRSQRYDSWIQEAGCEIMRQRPAKCLGRVELHLQFGEPDKRKRDVSNLIKPVEDLLVKHGIIEADDSSIVRGVHASWSDAVSGCRVTVERAG